MSTYKYATLLRATTDDPHPENDVSEGDLDIKAGKHEDGDQYTVMAEEQLAVVAFETVAVYEADQKMSKREAAKFARDRAAEDPEISNDV